MKLSHKGNKKIGYSFVWSDLQRFQCRVDSKSGNGRNDGSATRRENFSWGTIIIKGAHNMLRQQWESLTVHLVLFTSFGSELLCSGPVTTSHPYCSLQRLITLPSTVWTEDVACRLKIGYVVSTWTHLSHTGTKHDLVQRMGTCCERHSCLCKRTLLGLNFPF